MNQLTRNGLGLMRKEESQRPSHHLSEQIRRRILEKRNEMTPQEKNEIIDFLFHTTYWMQLEILDVEIFSIYWGTDDFLRVPKSFIDIFCLHFDEDKDTLTRTFTYDRFDQVLERKDKQWLRDIELLVPGFRIKKAFAESGVRKEVLRKFEPIFVSIKQPTKKDVNIKEWFIEAILDDITQDLLKK